MDKKMTEEELVQFLSEKISDAMNEDGKEVSTDRQNALDYYLGEMYGNEREGYSQYRSREVLETVEWALPSLLRVFTSGDNVVSFEPVGPEDEAQAEQETDVVNDAISRQDDFFLSMHSWFKSALLDPVAYARIWMDEKIEAKSEEYDGLTEAEVAQIVNDPDVEVLEQEEKTIAFGEIEIPVYDVHIRRTVKRNHIRIEAVPGEETLIDPTHTSLNLDEVPFICHRSKKTYSWLVQMGYDRELLDDTNPDEGEQWSGEAANRLFTEDESWNDETTDKSMRTYWVHDISVLVDFDGDGVAERRKIVMIGDKIHENDEYDYQPYVAISSVPMPYRHIGLSLAQLVMDLQLLKSTLIRQLMDNVYRQARNRTYVGVNAITDDGKTMQALLDPLSEYIPVEDHNMIRTEIQPSYINDLLPVIQYVGDVQQTRTGIAPNLSLDPAVIQQSTMGAFSGALEQASQRVEMIARVFAETGFKWLIKKAHRLLKEHSQRPFHIKRKGQWIEVNPSDWRDRENVSVSIGLGFNDKGKELGSLMQILGLQKEAMMAGIDLTTPNHIFNTLEDLVSASGRKSAERYFSRPDPNKPPQQKPDPNMVIAQAQAEAMKMDAQSKIMRSQIEGQKAQFEAQKSQFESQLKMREAELRQREAELKAQVAITEADIKKMQAQADVQNTVSDTYLKDAQRLKTLSEVKSLNLENQAVESGVVDFIEGVNNAASP